MSASALAGCGATAAPSTEPSPTPSTSTTFIPFDCGDAAYSESVSAETLECKTFTSTAGIAPEHDLSWLTSTPLQMSFMRMNGSLTMLVRMPCGVLNVPVAVSTEKITPVPDGMIQSADGCYGPEAEYRAWTTGYLKKPLTFVWEKQLLVLTNDLGQINFKSS